MCGLGIRGFRVWGVRFRGLGLAVWGLGLVLFGLPSKLWLHRSSAGVFFSFESGILNCTVPPCFRHLEMSFFDLMGRLESTYHQAEVQYSLPGAWHIL